MFGGRNAIEDAPLDNSVLIIPGEDNWNDFGFTSKVDIFIYVNNKKNYYIEGAFLGRVTNDPNDENGVVWLNSLLNYNGGGVIIDPGNINSFFTMLPSMETYRTVVQEFGVTLAVSILKSIKDLVVIDEYKVRTIWLDSALNSQIFLKSFIRSSEAYFAYKNAGSILRGLSNEKFYQMSEHIDINFKLSGRKNNHTLSFKFDHDAIIPKRIAVIIGKNGVGKSQTLRHIVQAALKGTNSLADADRGERVLINRILAFAPTNETSSVFPSAGTRPSVWYKRFSLTRSGTTSKKHGIADLLLQLARSKASIGLSSRWDIFLTALEAIDNWEQICLPLKEEGYIFLKAIKVGGEKRKLENYSLIDTSKEPLRVVDDICYPLSSGEASFLLFAAQASLHIENGSLLLLDEPETHLHPNFISQFVSLLDNLLEQTGSAAIVATHSVYFVREVFREQVTVLRNEKDGYLKIEQPVLKTFGADVGAISYFVFGEDEPSRLASIVKARLLKKYNNWHELYAQYKDELSSEMLNSLRTSMEARNSDE